jgi:alkylhydroperoxidase/carboxymuconolactone decarboxylase family protein YurZ
MTTLTDAPLERLASQFPPDLVREGADEALFDAVDGFWAAVYAGPHLTLRMKELVMVALHAASSALNAEALARHVRRALAAGASETDVVDVLVTIIPLANHPLYIGIPVLQDELRKAGRPQEADVPEMRPDILAIKEEFVRSRGYWTAMRDTIGSLMPEYFAAFIAACMEPWRSGSLAPAERELMYIAIDTSITHTYEPGMRMHIQNALRYGATPGQILEVFQLAALLGTEGYVLGLSALRDRR